MDVDILNINHRLPRLPVLRLLNSLVIKLPHHSNINPTMLT